MRCGNVLDADGRTHDQNIFLQQHDKSLAQFHLKSHIHAKFKVSFNVTSIDQFEDSSNKGRKIQVQLSTNNEVGHNAILR